MTKSLIFPDGAINGDCFLRTGKLIRKIVAKRSGGLQLKKLRAPDMAKLDDYFNRIYKYKEGGE